MEQYEKSLINEIIEKWSNMPGKMAITNIEDRHIRENMAKILENQDRVAKRRLPLMLEASKGTTTVAGATLNDTGAGAFAPVTLALMRRTFPGLFAHKVVGVQAMTGPVGLAFAIRTLYNTTLLPTVEAAFNDVDGYSGFTGTSAATSGGPLDSGEGVATATAEGWTIGSDMPELTVRVDQTAITAKSRKLAASFSLEAEMDIAAMHSFDLEREMIDILQYEITAELDRQLVYKMKSAAIDTANGGAAALTYNVSSADGRWSQEKFSNMITQIINKSNDIAIATRRGAGNFVIVSPRVATALQAAGPQFSRNQAIVGATNGLVEVGTINGQITVYRDSYAASTNDYALVGFKGTGVRDSGIIYSPYVTGLVSRAVAQEDFSPRIGVMSRYAITDSLLGSGRYYRLINFTNLTSIIN